MHTPRARVYHPAEGRSDILWGGEGAVFKGGILYSEYIVITKMVVRV